METAPIYGIVPDRPRPDMVSPTRALPRFAPPTFVRANQMPSDEFTLIEALVRARTAAKLTQAELARRLGTTQSAIARLEAGGVSPSFATLRRYAGATGTRLTVGLEADR